MIAPPPERRPSLHGHRRPSTRSSRGRMRKMTSTESQSSDDEAALRRVSAGGSDHSKQEDRQQKRSSRSSSKKRSHRRTNSSSTDKDDRRTSRHDRRSSSPRTIRRVDYLDKGTTTTKKASSSSLSSEDEQPIKRTSESSRGDRGKKRSSHRSSRSSSSTKRGLRTSNSIDKEQEGGAETNSSGKRSSSSQRPSLADQKNVSASTRTIERSDDETVQDILRSIGWDDGERWMNSNNASEGNDGDDTGLKSTGNDEGDDGETAAKQRPSLRGSGSSLRRMNSIERTDNDTVQHALRVMERGHGDGEGEPVGLETPKPMEKQSVLSRVPRSSRTMRRMVSMERSDDETLEQAITKESAVGVSQSMHGRRSSLDNNGGAEDPLEGAGRKNRSKSMHNRRSSIDHNKRSSIGNNNQTGSNKGHHHVSKSSHNRRSSVAVGEGGTSGKRHRSRSRSIHGRKGKTETTEQSTSSEKRRSSSRHSKSRHQRSGSSNREAGENKRSSTKGSASTHHRRSVDHRSGRDTSKEGSIEKKNIRSSSRTPKTSLQRAVEESKREKSPVPLRNNNKASSSATKGTKQSLLRSKSVDSTDEAIQRARSMHRRSVSKPEEPSPRRASSVHRRSISMNKPEESAPRSIHRRSLGAGGKQLQDQSPCRGAAARSIHRISMGGLGNKPEEPPCRATRSFHRRSIGAGKQLLSEGQVKNERIPRSRRTSVMDARKSLLDMHLNNNNNNNKTEHDRPRSKSPTERRSNLRSMFVRSNSCDSRRSNLEDETTEDITKSKLLEPLPPLQRKMSGQVKLQRKGTIERRQTLALLDAQALAKPELEDSHKQRLADLGKQFKSSALDISKIAEKTAGVKEKLSKLPSLNQKKCSSLTGALNTGGLPTPLLQPPTSTLAPTAASIALQPIKPMRRERASVTSEGIHSLVNLKELPPIGKAGTSSHSNNNLHRSFSMESVTDFSASIDALSTASLSQSVHSGKTTGTVSTASLSLSQSAHSRSSNHSGNSNRSDPSAIQARAQRLKQLSQAYKTNAAA